MMGKLVSNLIAITIGDMRCLGGGEVGLWANAHAFSLWASDPVGFGQR